MKLLTTGLCLYSLNEYVSANVIQITGDRTYCDVNPCENGAECLMKAGKMYCECTSGWNGQKCDVPDPVLLCSPDSMKISINKRLLVKDPSVNANSERVALGTSTEENCQAKLVGDNYEIAINSPFQDNCGTELSRHPENGNYIFSNNVQWTSVFDGADESEAPIQRRQKLVDFNCHYEDEYLLHMKPLKPAESVIEKDISKGNFNVHMSLWKNSDFENDINGQYSDNPIIRIDQKVCVKIDLESNLDMRNLVLSASDCWAAGNDNPTEEEKHYMIKDKCRSEEDYTTTVKSNGVATDVKFCFQLAKWKQEMDQLFIQCKMSVCDDSIQFDGVSQCVCPPKGYEINAWFYPNYYDYINNANNFEDYYGYGLYGDDAYDDYSRAFYYDYVNPWQPDQKRKKRSTEEEEVEEMVAENQLAIGPNGALPSSDDYVPVKYNGAGQHKRKRFDFKGLLRNSETGELDLPEGVKQVPKADFIDIAYGPIQVKEAETHDPEALQHKFEESAEIQVTRLSEEIEWFETEESANNVVLMAVGGALILAIIILGVVIGVYVQFRSKDKERALENVDDKAKVKNFMNNVMSGNIPSQE